MKRHFAFLLVPLVLLAAACALTPQVGGAPAEVDATQPPIPQTGVTSTAGSEGTQPATQTPPASAAPATTEPLPAASAAPSQALPDDDTFEQALANAIVSRDYEALRAAMGERFTIGYWRSEGSEMPAAEALDSLREIYLVQGSDPVTDTGIDLARLLDGADPLLIFGPQSNAVWAFHIAGLGQDAAGEAIAVVSRDPASGRPYWYGMLAAMDGFLPDTDPLGDLNAFGERLAAAIEARDFEALRGLMRARFSIATWNTQLMEFTSEEALKQIREQAPADGSTPAVVFGTDVTLLLEGTDPLSLWGPVANPVKAVHVMGLGPQANEEAVLAIGWDQAGGGYYWHGILLPPDGYFHSEITPEPGEVVETEVEYVMALEDVNMRSGPGFNYAVEGLIHAGQIARVSGISADGEWWRVVCTQDASGFCWISTNPDLTEPADAP